MAFLLKVVPRSGDLYHPLRLGRSDKVWQVYYLDAFVGCQDITVDSQSEITLSFILIHPIYWPRLLWDTQIQKSVIKNYIGQWFCFKMLSGVCQSMALMLYHIDDNFVSRIFWRHVFFGQRRCNQIFDQNGWVSNLVLTIHLHDKIQSLGHFKRGSFCIDNAKGTS